MTKDNASPDSTGVIADAMDAAEKEGTNNTGHFQEMIKGIRK